MKNYSQKELDGIWGNIQNGKYGSHTVSPKQLPAEPGADIMSIPESNGTSRRVFERKGNGTWKECPEIGEKSDFE